MEKKNSPKKSSNKSNHKKKKKSKIKRYDVVTLSRFTPGSELRPGLLWVVEQIPGLVVAADQTATLERGSWPAYTVPFYPEVARESGITSFVERGLEETETKETEKKEKKEKKNDDGGGKINDKKAVKWLSYQLSPRAMLFRRDANSLASAADLRSLMRSNTFKKGDPLTRGDPVAAICGRGDLEDGTTSAGSPRQASGKRKRDFFFSFFFFPFVWRELKEEREVSGDASRLRCSSSSSFSFFFFFLFLLVLSRAQGGGEKEKRKIGFLSLPRHFFFFSLPSTAINQSSRKKKKTHFFRFFL